MFQMIGAPFTYPACMFKMHGFYKNIDIPESSYKSPKGRKADNLKLLLLSQVLQNTRFGFTVSNTSKHFNATMFLPEFNSNKRAVGKPNAASFDKIHIEYK